MLGGGEAGVLARLFSFSLSQIGNDLEIFSAGSSQRRVPQIQFVSEDARLGGCCQWVLDAVFQTVEWFHQPLGFDSLTLLVESLDLLQAA